MSKDGRPRKNGYGSKRNLTRAEKLKAKVEKMNAEKRANNGSKRMDANKSGKATDLEQVKMVGHINDNNLDDEIPTMSVGQIWSLKSKPSLQDKGVCEISCTLTHPHQVVIVSCQPNAGTYYEGKFSRIVKALPLVPVGDLNGDDELVLLADQLENPFNAEYAIQCWNPLIILFHNFNAKVGQVRHGSPLMQMLGTDFTYPSLEQLRIKELLAQSEKLDIASHDKLRIKCYRSMKYIRHPYDSIELINERLFVQKMTKYHRV